MNANVGRADRLLRLLLGLVLLSQVFFGLRTAWGWFGMIFIATSAVRFCPVYRLLGLRTCRAACE